MSSFKQNNLIKKIFFSLSFILLNNSNNIICKLSDNKNNQALEKNTTQKINSLFIPIQEKKNEITVSIPKGTLSPTKTDITFMIADMKFNGTDLRILEFGEGPRSRFEGYDAINGKGAMWQQFWHHLKNFNLPIYYVGPEMHLEHAREIDYQTFMGMNGRHFFNLHQIMPQIMRSGNINSLILNKKISDQKGIIVIRHQNTSSPIIKAFKQRFPEFIILDSSSAPFLNNKYSTSTLFEFHEEIKKLRPPSMLYKKSYTTDLVSKIKKDFYDTDIVVIKPLTACKGYGIIMTTKDKLNYILYNILNKTDVIKKSKDTSYNYWMHDENEHFLIERYEKSKFVTLPEQPDKHYDATMRMVFVLSYQNETIHFKLLDGYWKLPLKAQEEEGSLTEKIKSKINPNRQSSLSLSPEDTATVCAILKQYMPAIYYRMLTGPLPNF